MSATPDKPPPLRLLRGDQARGAGDEPDPDRVQRPGSDGVIRNDPQRSGTGPNDPEQPRTVRPGEERRATPEERAGTVALLDEDAPLPDEVVVDAEMVDDPPGDDEDDRAVVLVDQAPLVERVDLVSTLAARHAERQPIIAPWLRKADERRLVVKYWTQVQAHRVAYHGVRVPLYGWKLTVRAPRGGVRGTVRLIRWVRDINSGDADRARRLMDADRAAQGMQLLGAVAARVRTRTIVALATAFVTIVGGILIGALAATWIQALCTAAAMLLLGTLGVDRDRPVFTRAVLPSEIQPLTSDIVIRGLGATGLSELRKAAERGTGINFVAPIMRDGPGWRAEIDLPYGVTADAVIEKRRELASGLRRPLGCVWPEPVSEEHPGRLILWVGDVEMRKAKARPWPLATDGVVDVFQPVKYGLDVRGRWVPVTLMFASLIIGSIPRMGKTFLLRLMALIFALDPRSELHLYDLKGTGDLSPLECVAHRYRAGEEDDDFEYAIASMRELKAELRRRAKVIRELPKNICPENKVTSQLASIRSLRLHPIGVFVDECQVWFEHPVYGEELESICTDLVKRGPALGIVAAYATQRPDAKSLPPGISANAVLRFCLKVMGHIENDMVIGSGMNKSGIKAQTFSRKDLGIHYLAGEGDDARIVRGVYVDAPGAEQIAQRARVLREEAGTLSGYALGENIDTVQQRSPYDLLEDILAITSAAEEKIWNSVVVDRLVELRPEVYEHWAALTTEAKTAALTAALKPFDIEIIQVWGTTDDGQGANRRGFERASVADVHAARKRARAGV